MLQEDWSGGFKPKMPSTRDLAVVLGLIAGAFIVFTTPRTWYLGLCGLLARASTKGAAAAKIAADLGGIPVDRAASIGRELRAWKLMEGLLVIRGLLLGRPIDVACTGAENLRNALAEGRGAILWIGDFALAGDVVKIGLCQLGYRHMHVSRPEHGFSESQFGIAYLNPIRTRYEESFRCQRLVIDRSAPNVIRSAVIAALAKNQIVSTMATAHEGRRFEAVEFLNGYLSLLTGILDFGRQTESPILPVFVVSRDGGNHFDLVIESPLSTAPPDRETDHSIALADFARRLERYVRDFPGAWHGWRRPNLTAAKPAASPDRLPA
jgi:lauroyl/myristoyl acyltransferase